MPIKLKKTLYVGVGGTGADTLLKVKKCFFDSYGEIPPMIGFIVIDTDGAASRKSITSRTGEPLSLLQSELFVCTVKKALAVYHANPNVYNWVPKPKNNVAALGFIMGGGAGQVRSNGHFIAYYNNANIKNAVKAKLNQINAPLPVNSKYAVDMNADGMTYPIDINVVSSIAGGTGSGMLVDVLCIINDVVRDMPHKLYPWIVLPEIFTAMSSGPSMANVFYNSYGALRELDYIMHYNPNDTPINLGYTKISDRLFDYAYLINNTNLAGTTFNSIEDLTEVIAKSMFLPANEMGAAITTPFDNIMVQGAAGTYDIRGKSAWAATASSAELLYDGQAVGRAYAYRTTWQLCESMMSSPSEGTADANAFVGEAAIQEHEKNDIIDFLLNEPPYEPDIDDDTDLDGINAYLRASGETSLKGKLQKRLDEKYTAAKDCFNKKIDEIMRRPEGKVGAAIQFIESLQTILDICKDEMTKEANNFHNINEAKQDWNDRLNDMKKKFFKKAAKIKDLKDDLMTAATNIREELHRNWALKFYAQFDIVINEKLTQLQVLKSSLQQISNNCRAALVAEQQRALTGTLFQVFLHKDDVMSASHFVINDNIKADFLAFLGEKGAYSWLTQSKEYIDGQLWDFAKGTPKVKEAVNTTVDQVLQGMGQEEVRKYLDRIKDMASPLWTHDEQGYNSQAAQLDRFIVVGVGNRGTSILTTDPAYKGYFDIAGHKASFASTHQEDRIYILVVEDLLPIYAVNNFKEYERDHNQKIANGTDLANYIDESLNDRMNKAGFNIAPAQNSDDVLIYWVYGFVFGYINYDGEGKTYWIQSKKKGDALKDYRYNLGGQRDTAYAQFISEHLYDEIDTALDKKMERNGRSAIERRIQEIKDNKSYYPDVAQLSPSERENIDSPIFQSVRDLVKKEIDFINAD